MPLVETRADVSIEVIKWMMGILTQMAHGNTHTHTCMHAHKKIKAEATVDQGLREMLDFHPESQEPAVLPH